MRVPDEAGIGKAKVTISFAAWKVRNVVPTTLDIPVCEPVDLASLMKKPELLHLPAEHGIAEFGGGGDRAWILAEYLAKYQDYLNFPLQQGEADRLQQVLKEVSDATERKGDFETFEKRGLKERTLLAQLPKALTALQVKRFQGLHCQYEGLMVLRHHHYAKMLALGDHQKVAIAALVNFNHDRALALQRAIFVSRGKEAVPLHTDLIALSWKLDSQIVDVLSPRQRQQWIDLLGAPLKWPDGVPRVCLAPDGTKISVVGNDVRHPRFSPDGKQLIFISSSGADDDLCVMDLENKRSRRLNVGHLQPTEGGCASPDGSLAAFTSHRAGTVVFDLKAGKVRTKTSAGYSPAFSPNGQWIVVQENEDMYDRIEPGALRLLNADGKGAIDLHTEGYNPQFSADGRIVFLAGKEGVQDVWSMKVDGTDKRQLTKTGGLKRGLSAAARADRLVFVHTDRKLSELWEISRLQLNCWSLYEMSATGADAKRVNHPDRTMTIGAACSFD